MKKATSLLVPALLLGLSAAIVQSCASGETDPAYSGGGSGGDNSGDGSGGDTVDGSGGKASSGGSTGTSSGGAPASSGGVTGSSSGGKVGSGGSSTSSGGKTGSGGTKSGGTTGTSSGGKTGSGGTTTSGTGGTIISTSSGGTTGTMSCTKQDATMTVNNGMATSGTWSGYAYTYVGSTPATITPACGSTGTCFMTAAKQLCVSGSVGPDPNFGASAGFGWDIGGTASSGTAGKSGSTGGSTKPAIAPGGTGLAYNVPGITTSMRIQVEDAAGNDYCATVPTANMGTIPWGMFAEKCYNSPPGTAYTATTKITSVQIVVPTTSGTASYPFCFCVLSLGAAG